MAASAFCFALMAALIKLLLPQAAPQVIVFWRGAGMALIFAAVAQRRGVSLLGHNRRTLLLRGVVGYLAVSCYFASVQHLKLGDAVLLQYSNPLFVALLAPLFMAEPSGRAHWALVGIAFAGLGLVVGAEGSLDSGVALGLTGSLGSGIAYMSVRHLTRTDHALTIMFWFPAVSVLGSLAMCLADGTTLWPATLQESLGLAAVMLTGLAGQVVLTLGLARTQAARATAITMTGPVFGLIFGWLFFQQAPLLLSSLGALVVITALCMLALRKPAQSAVDA
ncbi:MAG: DMT family transporter [Planctomycetes bacterium]|nr:DMT family transporter [Planctomycetota bacterium]